MPADLQIEHWNLDGTDGYNNSVTIIINQDHLFKVYLVPVTLTLNITLAANGTTTPTAALHNYTYGTTANITATPSQGYSFAHWILDGTNSTTNTTIQINMNTNHTLTPVFTQDTYYVTVITVGEGSCTPENNTSFLSGTEVEFRIKLKLGWSFAGWTGDINSTEYSIKINIYNNLTVTATFIQDVYTLTMITVGEGTVQPGNQSYLSGTEVNINATNAWGWTFTGWTEDTTGAANTTITMTGNLTVTATFTQDTYYLTMITVGNGLVQPGNQSYLSGSNVTLTALSAVNWGFSIWSGNATGSSFVSSIIMDGNMTVTATFTKIQYAVTFKQTGLSSDFTGAVVNIDGTNYTAASLPKAFVWYSGSVHAYQYFSPLSVNDGKQYIWTSTAGISTSQTASITVMNAGEVTANYATQYYLTINSEHGVAVDSGWYNAEATAYAVLENGTVAAQQEPDTYSMAGLVTPLEQTMHRATPSLWTPPRMFRLLGRLNITLRWLLCRVPRPARAGMTAALKQLSMLQPRFLAQRAHDTCLPRGLAQAQEATAAQQHQAQ